ncbi:MAG: AMP-binding protein, partial [Flavobacteriales bacterium]
MGHQSISEAPCLIIEGETLDLKEFGSWRQWMPDSQWKVEIKNTIDEWYNSSDQIEVQTSGSTGTPKKIVLHKKRMAQSAKATSAHFGLQPGCKALLCLPSKFIAGKMMVIRALVNGWKLYGVEPSLNLHSSFDHDLDFAAMTPHQMSSCLSVNDDFGNSKLTIILGGAAVSDLLRDQIKRLQASVHETYGMTETITHVATKVLNGLKSEEHFTCLPGIQFTLTSDNRLGFYGGHLEEAIETNDLAEPVDMKSFVLKGRADHVINSGGIKIHPSTLEKTLEKWLDVPYYITSMPHSELGEQVVLVLERAPLDHLAEQ